MHTDEARTQEALIIWREARRLLTASTRAHVVSRGSQSEVEQHRSHPPLPGSIILGCHPPPMLRGKLPGGGEGLTLQSTEVLVFQQRSVLDPVLILTSSLDSSIRVLVLLSRQN